MATSGTLSVWHSSDGPYVAALRSSRSGRRRRKSRGRGGPDLSRFYVPSRTVCDSMGVVRPISLMTSAGSECGRFDDWEPGGCHLRNGDDFNCAE